MSETLHKRFRFDQAQAEDLPAIISLAASVLGSQRAVPLDVMRAWMCKNPDVVRVLHRGEEIVGYACMLPLPKETIMQALKGKIAARGIPPDDIQPFSPFTPLTIYLGEVVAKQGMPGGVHVAARLITEIARFLIDLTHHDVWIEELYAVAVTPYGIRACRALGCQEMNLPAVVKTGRIPFRLVVQEEQTHAMARWVAQSGLS